MSFWVAAKSPRTRNALQTDADGVPELHRKLQEHDLDYFAELCDPLRPYDRTVDFSDDSKLRGPNGQHILELLAAGQVRSSNPYTRATLDQSPWAIGARGCRDYLCGQRSSACTL